MTERMSPEVLVLGSHTCVNAHAVVAVLRRRGVDHHYVDFQELDSRAAEVWVEQRGGVPRLMLAYPSLDRVVDTSRLRSAYFRETGPKHTLWQLSVAGGVRHLSDPDGSRHQLREVLKLSASVLEMLGRTVFCVHPRALSGFGANKTVQLSLARSLGLRIPDTYIGNDIARMRELVQRHAKVISKPFYPQSLYYGGQSFRTYTSLFTLDDLDAAAGHRWPLILQEAIVDKRDVRVAVVGRRVMAAEIQLEGGDGEILDFRHYEGAGLLYGGARHTVHRPHELPAAIHERCLALVRCLGLQYAMMDFALDARGEYVFIESNVKGMPGEVEQAGHDVTGAVVDLLLDPERLMLR